jgi:molybdopterin converting factor small subunit
MGIKIQIPYALQQVTENKKIVEVDGTTVSECIADFKRKYPNSRPWLSGRNPAAYVAKNQRMIKLDDMDQKITDSDELSIIMVLAGG